MLEFPSTQCSEAVFEIENHQWKPGGGDVCMHILERLGVVSGSSVPAGGANTQAQTHEAMVELSGYCLPITAVSFKDFRWGLGTAGVTRLNPPQELHRKGLSRLIEAHGLFTWQLCIDRHAAYQADKMNEVILAGSVRQMVKEADLVVMWSSLSIYLFQRGSGGQADGVAFLSGCGEGVGTLVERLGWTEELEEVWELVGGGSDKKTEADATRSDDAEAAKSIDAKVGRIIETMSMAHTSLAARRKV
ncbi:hypothetical protein HOY80DRAFT_1035508 [Tuber brumale]|nr:hypothetical protein HOY80DRAFT_1035508 [Tuber brumale]